MSCEMTDLTPSLERDKMELLYYCLKDGAREPDIFRMKSCISMGSDKRPSHDGLSSNIYFSVISRML